MLTLQRDARDKRRNLRLNTNTRIAEAPVNIYQPINNLMSNRSFLVCLISLAETMTIFHVFPNFATA